MVNEEARVVAVVVTYNSSQDVRQCVESLLAAAVDEVRILDNDSPEWTDRGEATTFFADLATLAPDRISWQLASTNLGFADGVRKLCSELDGFDFVWIVNPDAVVDVDSRKVLVAVAESADADVLSPVIETGHADTKSTWFAGGSLYTARGLSEHFTSVPGPFADADFFPCSFLTGAALFARVSSWRQLGGFDGKFFLYWEDADFCRRATEQGMVLGVAPRAVVWHRVGGSADGDRSDAYFYYMNRNRLAVCAGGSLRSKINVTFGRGARSTVRLFRAALREDAGRWIKLRACLEGLSDGFRGVTGPR